MENRKDSLTNFQIYTYGLGEFGFTFFLLFVGYYLMYFLTDVLALPAATAAVLYTMVQWFETITVVLSGTIMDRLTFKSGKYRPWILGGGFACMVGTILFFTKFNVPKNAYIILFPLFYLIAYWGYNFMWVAYRALNGVIGHTSQETVSLTVTGSQMGTISSLIFSAIGVKLLYAFSTIETGYTVSAAVYGGVMFLCLLAVYALAKKYDVVHLSNDQKVMKTKVSFKETIKGLKGPMLFFFISSTLRNSVTSVVNALIVYHFNYNLKAPQLMSLYMTSVTLGQLAGVFLVRYAAGKMDKKNMYLISSVASAAILTVAYFVSSNPLAFIICMTLNSFCIFFGGSLIPAFMNDISNYNEVELGVNTRAFTYSIGATAIRLASIIGGAAASFGLAVIGYNAGSVDVTATALSKLTALMTLFPAALMLICIFPMMLYKLDEKTMQNIALKKESASQN